MGQVWLWGKAAAQMLQQAVGGPFLAGWILFAGCYYTVGTGFFQFRHLGLWLGRTLGAILGSRKVRDRRDAHTISQFQAVSTALAGTIGTGNVIGVATALVAGGPGAVFWMWICALLGMMTKFAENVLGNRYRYRNPQGEWVGGPMVYIQRGLGCRWLAASFCLCCMLASFGIGNMSQANSISGALYATFRIPPLATGVGLCLCTGLVVLGGLQRLAGAAEKLVPFMAVFYTAGGLAVIALHWRQLPQAVAAIFQGAFGLQSAAGGIGGYTLSQAVACGVSRGIFSNEAGLGSSVIVSSASDVSSPLQQGMWGMFEVFVDTILVCTITALAILCSGAAETGKNGAALSLEAFNRGLGPLGGIFLAVAVCCFAFSAILGWFYYGQRSAEFLWGGRGMAIYQVLFLAATVVGCAARLEPVWALSDLFNGLMAAPNLIALALLSPQVFRITRAELAKLEGRKKQGLTKWGPSDNMK